jgi:hypothetical protein
MNFLPMSASKDSQGFISLIISISNSSLKS